MTGGFMRTPDTIGMFEVTNGSVIEFQLDALRFNTPEEAIDTLEKLTARAKETIRHIHAPSEAPSQCEIKVVEAGVDPNHQKTHCDDCKVVFKDEDDAIQTCSHTEYLTLCEECYDKRGNSVR